MADLLARLEAYLDAAPRSAADAEPVGKFTLFRSRGAWPYYGRPRLGLTESIDAADVDRLRERQRELGLPQNIEWVTETTPSLARAAAASGLEVHSYPLMVLERAEFRAIEPPPGVELRMLTAEDPEFARAHSVASVGFGAPGTAVGPQGAAERDAAAGGGSSGMLDFMRERARQGLAISAVALDESGPLAVGTHQPVGEVTEVVGVATLPAARRRGLAAALTSLLVSDALDRGVTTVFLSAGSDDVARVYERVGFRRIGSAGAAETSETAEATETT